jgi:DNA polymerase-3 subunit alpha
MAFTEAAKGEGVQPIIGTMLAAARPGGSTLDWLALYAQNAAGYDNLCALVSAAHLDRPVDEEANVPLDFLEGRSDGLIALTAGSEGALARLLAQEQEKPALEILDRLQALFPGRLYIELSRRGDDVEERAEARLIELAYQRDLPLVATNPARYGDPTSTRPTTRCCASPKSSQIGRDDRERSSPEAWIKPAAEMRRCSRLPEAIENSAVIARRCAYGAPKRKPILPASPATLKGSGAAAHRWPAPAGSAARPYESSARRRRKAYFDRPGL